MDHDHPTIGTTDTATSTSTSTSAGTSIVTIRPWVDPVVDANGFDPRGTYAERFWLGIIGPTALFVMRRMATEFDTGPDGFVLDLDHTARAMGLSYTKRANSPFGRAIQRCVMFGLAQPMAEGFTFRRRVPQVAQRHLRRLPDEVQTAHAEWRHRTCHVDARELEQQLIRAGVPAHAAASATEAALQAA